MERLDESVALGAPHFRPEMFNVLELQEKLVGMLVWFATELPSMIAAGCVYFHFVFREERRHVIVEAMGEVTGSLLV